MLNNAQHFKEAAKTGVDIYWMRIALKLAHRAELRGEVPVGAVLVFQDRVLATGSNRKEEIPSVTGHAEIQALLNYSQRFQNWRLPPGSTLYCTLEPCLLCTGALLQARLTHLKFGCWDPQNRGLRRILPLVLEGSFGPGFKTIVHEILPKTCSDQLKRFFRHQRRKERPQQLSAQSQPLETTLLETTLSMRKPFLQLRKNRIGGPLFWPNKSFANLTVCIDKEC